MAERKFDGHYSAHVLISRTRRSQSALSTRISRCGQAWSSGCHLENGLLRHGQDLSANFAREDAGVQQVLAGTDIQT